MICAKRGINDVIPNKKIATPFFYLKILIPLLQIVDISKPKPRVCPARYVIGTNSGFEVELLITAYWGFE